MDIEDIVRIGFILLIASGFLFRGGGNKEEAESEDGGPGQGRPGPRSLAESGGHERPVPRRDMTPAPANTSTMTPAPSRPKAPREELRERVGDVVDRAGSLPTREDIVERMPSAGSMPTAEERTPRARPATGTRGTRQATGSTGPERIRRALGNPQSVQTAIVLQEVLGKPVGMREDMK